MIKDHVTLEKLYRYFFNVDFLPDKFFFDESMSRNLWFSSN